MQNPRGFEWNLHTTLQTWEWEKKPLQLHALQPQQGEWPHHTHVLGPCLLCTLLPQEEETWERGVAVMATYHHDRASQRCPRSSGWGWLLYS